MTTPFYAPPPSFRGAHVTLPDEEAHHAGRVLRKRSGDEIVVVDGMGGWYCVRLDHVDSRQVAGTVVEEQREVGEPSYELTVGLAVLKSRNRFETFLEKAVELGVRRIMPLVTARTEKTGLKQRRAERILVAAMKQCGRSRLVELTAPQPFEEALATQDDALALICHEAAGHDEAFLDVLTQHKQARELLLFVGPEGGFSEEEMVQATEAGCLPVSLGARRLRAETAALAAAAGVMLARTA